MFILKRVPSWEARDDFIWPWLSVPTLGPWCAGHNIMDPDYDEYKDVSKFKSYVADFQSSLALFERAKEWADLIKCLQRVTAVRWHSFVHQPRGRAAIQALLSL